MNGSASLAAIIFLFTVALVLQSSLLFLVILFYLHRRRDPSSRQAGTSSLAVSTKNFFRNTSLTSVPCLYADGPRPPRRSGDAVRGRCAVAAAGPGTSGGVPPSAGRWLPSAAARLSAAAARLSALQPGYPLSSRLSAAQPDTSTTAGYPPQQPGYPPQQPGYPPQQPGYPPQQPGYPPQQPGYPPQPGYLRSRDIRRSSVPPQPGTSAGSAAAAPHRPAIRRSLGTRYLPRCRVPRSSPALVLGPPVRRLAFGIGGAMATIFSYARGRPQRSLEDLARVCCWCGCCFVLLLLCMRGCCNDIGVAIFIS